MSKEIFRMTIYEFICHSSTIKKRQNINFTYTSDFIDDLLSKRRSSGVDARRIARASSGVKLCVANSFYRIQNKFHRFNVYLLFIERTCFF